VINRSTTRDTPIDPMASFEGRNVVWNPCRGNHLGQRSSASASTGRTYGRNDLIKTLQNTLRGGGRPHMGLGHCARRRTTSARSCSLASRGLRCSAD
jgi:hypothetical protein